MRAADLDRRQLTPKVTWRGASGERRCWNHDCVFREESFTGEINRLGDDIRVVWI